MLATFYAVMFGKVSSCHRAIPWVVGLGGITLAAVLAAACASPSELDSDTRSPSRSRRAPVKSFVAETR
jgi:uncharacterized membrane protein YuzA (DUF378 family)